MAGFTRRQFLNTSMLAGAATLIPSAFYGAKLFNTAHPMTDNAIDLLTAFSGVDAKRFAPLFKYSNESRIVEVEIHTVGTEDTSLKYTGDMEIGKQVNNILRIKTVDGFEGVSGIIAEYEGRFGDHLLLELQSIIPNLLKLQSFDPVQVEKTLIYALPKISDAARASIDIALWDLAAKKADKPLYQILGAKRETIEVYASLPFYNTHQEYIDAIKEYAKQGYNTFKFHVWGEIKNDFRLVEMVQEAFADTNYQFMMDLEEKYGYEDAIKLGKQMDKGLFIWF